MAEDNPASHPGFTRKILVTVGVAALVVALMLIIVFVARPLLVIFAGVLLAVLLRALTDIVHRYTRIPCGVALWVVVLTIIGLIVGASWFLAAQASTQFEQLGVGLTDAWHRLHDYIAQFGWGRTLLEQLSGAGLPAGGADVLGRIVGGTLGAMSMLVVSVFLGLYLAVNPNLYRRGMLRLLPLTRRERGAEILHKMSVALRGWLLGTLFNMFTIGTVTTVGLWLLGIPMALALGIIAFFLEFVPYLGPIASAVPALLIASTVGPTEMVYTALFYWAVQSAEGYLLSPLVYQHSVDLPPALTVGAQIILATLFGVLGIVFATPLTACALILVQEAYIKDALGDRIKTEDERAPA